jgi:hypothetical protein
MGYAVSPGGLTVHNGRTGHARFAGPIEALRVEALGLLQCAQRYSRGAGRRRVRALLDDATDARPRTGRRRRHPFRPSTVSAIWLWGECGSVPRLQIACPPSVGFAPLGDLERSVRLDMLFSRKNRR